MYKDSLRAVGRGFLHLYCIIIMYKKCAVEQTVAWHRKEGWCVLWDMRNMSVRPCLSFPPKVSLNNLSALGVHLNFITHSWWQRVSPYRVPTRVSSVWRNKRIQHQNPSDWNWLLVAWYRSCHASPYSKSITNYCLPRTGVVSCTMHNVYWRRTQQPASCC